MKIHNGAVVLRPTQAIADQIREVIPRAAQGVIDGKLTLAVKHKLEETLVLRNIGFDIPSPLAHGWGFPGMYKPFDNQVHTAAFATLYRRAFILNEMRCVDANTEYLSPQGWRRIADYDGCMVAQYDKDTECADFVQPTEYIKKPVPEEERMLWFLADGLDMVLTKNHRVLWYDDNRIPQISSAEGLRDKLLKGDVGGYIKTSYTLDGAKYLSHNFKAEFRNRGLIKEVSSPDGYCYCFSVPKTFLVMRRNGCVFITGNTGKTASALWAAEYLLQEDFLRRVLIVSPKQCMQDVWSQALFECLPHRSSAILHGSREKRLKELDKGTDFCIINHDGLAALSEKVKMRGKNSTRVDCKVLTDLFDLIIYDEADVLCNQRNLGYKALTSLIRPETWLWLMTGTPTPNEYADAWGLLKLVRGDNLPVRSYTQFRELMMVRVSPYKWVNKSNARQILFDLMQPAIRFTQAQCFDLPKVVETWRTAELSQEQKVAYHAMQRDGKMDRGEEPAVRAMNAAIKVAKMLQISVGAVRDDDGNKVSLDSRPRLETLLGCLAESGVRVTTEPTKKAIVFMPFKYAMEVVHDYLEKQGIRCSVVNGDVGMAQRRIAFDCFKTGDCQVLVAHPEVTAHGLDLTCAETVIWYAPCFGNRLYAQANMRHQGVKQKGVPAIVHIYATKLEKERYNALKAGGLNQEELLALYERALDEQV